MPSRSLCGARIDALARTARPPSLGVGLASLGVSVGIALGLVGCVHSGGVGASASGAPAEPPAPRVAPVFAYDDRRFDATQEIVEPAMQGRAYAVRRVVFPSVGDNGQSPPRVVGRWLAHTAAGPRRLVIVLPIWGRSDVFPIRRISQTIMGELPRTDVFLLRGPKRLIEWSALSEIATEAAFHRSLERLAQRLRVNVIDARRIIDWADTEPELDAGRVGVVGLSISALAGGMLLANEPRIQAGVLAMGAGQPGKVLAQCNGRFAEARNHALSAFGWSLERYRRETARHFETLEAATGAPWPGSDNVLIFDALFDRCMPRSAQDALWERMGRPRRISFLAGHQSAFLMTTPLGLNAMNHRIVDFFDPRL